VCSSNLCTLDELKCSIYETITSIEVSEHKLISNSLFQDTWTLFKRTRETFWASTVMVSFLNNLFTFRNAHKCYNVWHISHYVRLLFLSRWWGYFGFTSQQQESQVISSWKEVFVWADIFPNNNRLLFLKVLYFHFYLFWYSLIELKLLWTWCNAVVSAKEWWSTLHAVRWYDICDSYLALNSWKTGNL
jgi:hypothetical protein